MEYRDIYNENREIIRHCCPKDESLAEGEYIVAVGIWVINSNKEILLTKRAPEKRYAPNKWENTGGHLQSGEDIQQAVIRELKEETGISVTEEEMIYLGSVKNAPYFGEDYMVFKDIPLENMKLQPGETVDAKYVTLEEFMFMAENGEFPKSLTDHLRPKWERFVELLS